MNIEYLTKELLPQRAKEFETGANLGSAQPIYVVLDLTEKIISGHTDYLHSTNLKGIEHEWGFFDESLDSEDIQFKTSSKRMKQPVEVTRFYIDTFVAFFLTSKGAHEYLQYQKHNLNKGYVYVFNAGYRNIEMDKLFIPR